jgi:hypothetical protein
MRPLIAALVIALSIISADAQSDRSLTGSENSNRYEHFYDPKIEKQKVRNRHHEKIHEKKYNDVLESIPDSDETFDPWKNAR